MKERFSTDEDPLGAFSDGTIVTIMVLDLRPPHGTYLNSLASVLA